MAPRRSNRRGANPEAQNKDVWLTVPVEQRHDALVKVAAGRDGRAVAAYVRYLILTDLRNREFVDADFNLTDTGRAVAEQQEAAEAQSA